MREFNWSPGIGDPTIGGWVTVALYLITAVVTWRVARRLRASDGSAGVRSEAIVWAGIALLFVALGINKQLDLQTAFTELGRVLSRSQGWYDYRGKVQFVFILGVASVCAVAAVLLLFLIRRAPAATWLAAVGTVSVLFFVLIRAASFHHMDMFIGSRILGLAWNWILEMGGISMVLFAGLRR